MYAGDYARLNVQEIEVFGIQPSVFNASLDDFNVPYWTSKSKLSLSEQLYTAKGSQSIGIGQFIAESTSTDPEDFTQNIFIQSYVLGGDKPNKYYLKRPAFTMKQAPYFGMKDRRGGKGGTASVVMNVPSFNRMMSNTKSLNETVWETLLIKMRDPKNTEHIQQVIETMKLVMSEDQLAGITFQNHFDDSDTDEMVNRILDWIFNVIIAITMFLCFFSLCSSMSANLYD
jgi:hypothetical protein